MMKNTKLNIIEKGITYSHRHKERGIEYISFRSKEDLNLNLDDISEEFLLRMESHNGYFHCSIFKSRVIKMVEDKSGFSYKLSGKIYPLSEWEYGLVKKRLIKQNDISS